MFVFAKYYIDIIINKGINNNNENNNDDNDNNNNKN